MTNGLSEWRLERAMDTFNDGEQLLAIGSNQGAINRFYYAAFYAVRALLALNKLDSPKHSGVMSLFNKEFVKTQIISKESSKTFTNVFALRAQADYEDFKIFSTEEAKKVRDSVRELIKEISTVINKEHLTTPEFNLEQSKDEREL
ncbi:hypothetical protein SDC9_21115 [bioreactor metagenome]|uniref:HEPN domain-containing protein n=1 Tax=bioreactor metagenome TaxID=1076179 RepID=A0A644U8M0_9ZZZZ|nr:HEPN domain-containing protein [Desulfitobacterium hafniense]MEA5023439.1 HEPN domain-containing protein [Desulfitobacterium hafniense]